jgi:putative membrane protein
MGYGYGGHMMYGYGGWFMWIIILVLVILVIYLFSQQKRYQASGSMDGETAMDILKKRLARGEITSEEYEKLKKDLQ